MALATIPQPPVAERFLFVGESVEVLFVSRERERGAYRREDCLVAVGDTHDPTNYFFDHKPPAFADRHQTCAARPLAGNQ